MITVYQIRLTDKQRDTVNKLGHDSVPAQVVRLRMNMGFEGSGFCEDYLQYYTGSYEIDTDDLEEAFAIANGFGDFGKVQTFKLTAPSASVGDIFVKDGDLYICDTFGFVNVGRYDLAQETA